MAKLNKLILVTALVFINTLCFAEAKEEDNELNYAILGPIITHFTDASSYTRQMSKEIIKYQTSNKIKLDLKGTMALGDELAKKAPFNDDKYKCIRDKIDSMEETNSTLIAKRYLTAWTYKVEQCVGYANLALIAFEFNRMNSIVNSDKSFLFKYAVLVKAKKNGDHRLLLVEGNSGTMFAVDPWIREVRQLYNFTKLSDAKPLNTDDYKQLNSLYGVVADGVIYYDVFYVDGNTEWELRPTTSKNILDNMQTFDFEMENLYNTLYFPRWTTKYAKLMAGMKAYRVNQ
jgi:hypothetical protein